MIISIAIGNAAIFGERRRIPAVSRPSRRADPLGYYPAPWRRPKFGLVGDLPDDCNGDGGGVLDVWAITGAGGEGELDEVKNFREALSSGIAPSGP